MNCKHHTAGRDVPDALLSVMLQADVNCHQIWGWSLASPTSKLSLQFVNNMHRHAHFAAPGIRVGMMMRLQVIAAYYKSRLRRIVPAYMVLLAIHLLIHTCIQASSTTLTKEAQQVTKFWMMGRLRCIPLQGPPHWLMNAFSISCGFRRLHDLLQAASAGCTSPQTVQSSLFHRVAQSQWKRPV